MFQYQYVPLTEQILFTLFTTNIYDSMDVTAIKLTFLKSKYINLIYQARLTNLTKPTKQKWTKLCEIESDLYSCCWRQILFNIPWFLQISYCQSSSFGFFFNLDENIIRRVWHGDFTDYFRRIMPLSLLLGAWSPNSSASLSTWFFQVRKEWVSRV